MDPYMIITLAIMVGFVATFAALAIRWLLESDDEEPWVEPKHWRDESRKNRHWG